MNSQRAADISKFFVAGVNYKKSNAVTRGQFSIGPDQYFAILDRATHSGLQDLFVLSTCNRTEIYGLAETSQQLVQLLCSETCGDEETFKQLAYVRQGNSAIQHLFEVAAGLDSQILGDYEIVGQIKSAVKFSKEKGHIGTFMDRLVNFVLQSSKAIKNTTNISDGTVSVSFAAVQYIRENVLNIQDKKILLVGTGKIGRITTKNMVDYLGTRNITLINRTEEKAAILARELSLESAPLTELTGKIASSDIILVATNAGGPTIVRSQLAGNGEKLIIDLSIPYNVESAARSLDNVTVLCVDDLSKQNDETLALRKAEVPKANAIITKYIAEFNDWLSMRRHAPMLNAVKNKLQELHTSPLFFNHTSTTGPAEHNSEQNIQRVINGMASKIRQQNQGGCHYIEAINEFMAMAAG